MSTRAHDDLSLAIDRLQRNEKANESHDDKESCLHTSHNGLRGFQFIKPSLKPASLEKRGIRACVTAEKAKHTNNTIISKQQREISFSIYIPEGDGNGEDCAVHWKCDGAQKVPKVEGVVGVELRGVRHSDLCVGPLRARAHEVAEGGAECNRGRIRGSDRGGGAHGRDGRG